MKLKVLKSVALFSSLVENSKCGRPTIFKRNVLVNSYVAWSKQLYTAVFVNDI